MPPDNRPSALIVPWKTSSRSAAVPCIAVSSSFRVIGQRLRTCSGAGSLSVVGQRADHRSAARGAYNASSFAASRHCRVIVFSKHRGAAKPCQQPTKSRPWCRWNCQRHPVIDCLSVCRVLFFSRYRSAKWRNLWWDQRSEVLRPLPGLPSMSRRRRLQMCQMWVRNYGFLQLSTRILHFTSTYDSVEEASVAFDCCCCYSILCTSKLKQSVHTHSRCVSVTSNVRYNQSRGVLLRNGRVWCLVYSPRSILHTPPLREVRCVNVVARQTAAYFKIVFSACMVL